MHTHAAFLRGINIGGNKKVPMAELRTALEQHGYKNIVTVLASGNVLLEANEDATSLQKSLQTIIEQTFGFKAPVIIRTVEQLQALVKSQPFADVDVTKETRLNITFLPEASGSELSAPYTPPDADFSILQVSDTEVCNALTLTKQTGTLDLMKWLEQEFGKNITTRSWNTVRKLLLKVSDE